MCLFASMTIQGIPGLTSFERSQARSMYSKTFVCKSNARKEAQLKRLSGFAMIMEKSSRIACLLTFCNSEGIAHEFSAPITPQQNGIVERKNRTLQEMARVMMLAQNIPTYFWAEALNTACHIHNRVTLRPGMSLTLYEIWRGRKPNVKYFHVFGSTCYILVDREPRRKLDPRSDEGIFLGYSRNSRAYRVFNKWTKTL